MTLAELEGLPGPKRQNAVAQLGRAAQGGDAPARSLLRELAGHSDPWWRWLALLGLATAGDDASLLASLTDAARSVRERAWAQLLQQGQMPTLLTALGTQGHSKTAARLAGRLVRARSSPELEALMVRFSTNPVWLDRLPACSEATVRAALPELEARGRGVAWRAVARFHPRLLRDQLVAALKGVKTPDSRLTWRIHDVMSDLLAADPDAALDVVEALFDLSVAPQPLGKWIARLARLRPERTFDRLKARQLSGLPAPRPGLFSSVRFVRPDRLGLERLKWLVSNAPSALPEGSAGRAWMARLAEADRSALVTHWLGHRVGSWGAFLFAFAAPSPEREASFDGWQRAACNAEGLIAVARLHALPLDLRLREARRHLHELPWLQSRPVERRVYAELLGFDEAESELQPWLAHPEGTERGVALGLWLGTVRHDAARTPLAIAAVRRRKNEQDPVRQAMLAALARLPTGRLRATPVEELVGIVGEALDAADLSPHTAKEAQRLAAVVLSVEPVAGAELLTRVLRVRGSVDGHAIGARLTPVDAGRLDPVLAPLLDDWVRHERAAAALGLLSGLHHRLRHMPRTLDAVDALCGLPNLLALGALLDVLARHAPDRFAARALRIVEADDSAICLPRVARFVATVRTDLLGRFLGKAPMVGRWATGRTHWVLDFGLRFHGWTSAQQARYAALLVALVDTPDRDVPTCRWAMERLTRLTWTPSEPLRRLSSDPRPPIRDLAIRALPNLDDGSGLQALLDCMGGDRARIATYALRRELSELTPAAVIAQLRAVPMGRVTVAKEVVRLMGELGGPEARGALVAMGAGALHRDVRIALLRALWDHIESPEAWALLDAAARDPDPVLASRLLSIPLDRLSPAADARLAELFAHVLSRPEPQARLDFLDSVGPAPLRDHGRVLLGALVRHLATPDPAEAARTLGVVMQRMKEGEVPLVVARLAGLLPKRRHLQALVDRLAEGLHYWSPPVHVELAHALEGPLSADRLAAVPCIRLAARVRTSAEVAELLEVLEARGHLHHDAIVEACAQAAKGASPHSAATRLVRSKAPRLRRVALAALVAAAAPENGWTPERRALLAKLAADESLEVAAAAAWVFPPPG